MKNCPYCSNEISELAVVCVKCGADLSKKPKSQSSNSDLSKVVSLIKIGLIMLLVEFVISHIWSMLLAAVIIPSFDDIYAAGVFNTIIGFAFTAAEVLGMLLCFIGLIKLIKQPKENSK